MSWQNKLKYTGSDPFEVEEDLLPHNIYMSLTENDEYEKLSMLWWLAEETYQTVADLNDFPESIDSELLACLSWDDNNLRNVVDSYVLHWINENRQLLIDERDVTEEEIEEAINEYETRTSS